MDANATKLVELRDFEKCPLWRYDEEDDLYFPVERSDDLPTSERDVSILVECKTHSGHKFSGYIVGISKVFSMGLFCKNKTFYLNKNLPDLSVEQMQDLLECAHLAEVLSVKNLFPLEYSTQIRREEFRDFSGRFEIEVNHTLSQKGNQGAGN